MRPLSLAAALLLVPLAASAQDSCGPARSRLRLATAEYGTARAQLVAAERDLAALPGGEEAKLRSLRRYALVQREVDDRRNGVLQAYEDLVAAECDHYDQDGYEKTVANFRQASDAEREVLQAAKMRAGQVVTAQ